MWSSNAKEPKLATSMAGVRNLDKETWNVPGGWAAVPSPLFIHTPLFLGVAKQRSRFSCHSQVKWLHLLLSSQHMLLWCDPLLEQTAHIGSPFSLPPQRHCLAPELFPFCFSVGCSTSASSPSSFPRADCMEDGGRRGAGVFL